MCLLTDAFIAFFKVVNISFSNRETFEFERWGYVLVGEWSRDELDVLGHLEGGETTSLANFIQFVHDHLLELRLRKNLFPRELRPIWMSSSDPFLGGVLARAHEGNAIAPVGLAIDEALLNELGVEIDGFSHFGPTDSGRKE